MRDLDEQGNSSKLRLYFSQRMKSRNEWFFFLTKRIEEQNR